jgi:CubicO group peptidase (beta-lactamase class C family)
MSPLERRMTALIAEAGYRAEEPIMVGLWQQGASPLFVGQGRTAMGEPVTATTLAYAASLSKQMTAACAALLTKDGGLDIESPLSRWLPELPAWAGSARVRHLLHHTAGLPADSKIDAVIAGGGDRTTSGVLHALARFPSLDRSSGTEYGYSGAGYVCLATVVERAAGRPLPDFA